ncbi:putative serine/threonine-protein kinase [Tetrabaena socialis]|uniref:non-specific serine/threonine protein kinase n=1 Tax=Tetrabaena socialis TaxID=47790 RepID=A0A2J8AG99_9CHLO|nr:putative serine/threonine-protein kinase [Tetrabaena socialis]|eukprot:PNH11539.1 putative serine/threonine-protein kinase [Tetrabaena socialis]
MRRSTDRFCTTSSRGGVRIMGSVSAWILEGRSNFMSTYNPCGRVLHVDPATGSAVVAQVAARTLGELMAAAAAAAAAEEAAAAATAAGGVAAAAGDVAAAAGDVAAAVTAGADEPVKAAEVAAVAEEAAGTATAVAVKAAGPAGAEDAAARAAGLDRAASALGRALAVLHDGGQVHGSLSCGTVLLRDSDGAVVLTDFRRSRNTGLALDKAQDLAALEAALPAGAAHASAAEALFSKILTAYRSASRQWSATHNKLAEVRSRSGQANKKLKATETKG